MRRASLFLSLLAALALTPRPAHACSCTNDRTLQQEYDNAWVVFSGRVVSITADPFGTYAVQIDPIQRWKGPLQYAPIVVTPLNAAVCGYPFEVGTEYLIFAVNYGYGLTYTPTPFTHLCSRTAPLAGNPYISDLPAPLETTPAARPSWGTLKLRYR